MTRNQKPLGLAIAPYEPHHSCHGDITGGRAKAVVVGPPQDTPAQMNQPQGSTSTSVLATRPTLGPNTVEDDIDLGHNCGRGENPKT